MPTGMNSTRSNQSFPQKFQKRGKVLETRRPWRHTIDSVAVSGWPQRCAPVALELCRDNMSYVVEAVREVVHEPTGDLGLEELSPTKYPPPPVSIHRRSQRPTTHIWLLVVADIKNGIVDTKRPWSLTTKIPWRLTQRYRGVRHVSKCFQVQREQRLSQFHGTLLDICLFQSCRPDPQKVKPITGPTLTADDLAALAKMVLVEFAASLDKELNAGPNEEELYSVTTPHAYNVYLMKTTLGHQTYRLAVCIPIKGSKSLKGGLEWWDGCKNVWPLNSDTRLHRVASFSGSALVLQALSQASISADSMMGWAMRREMLVDVVDDRRVLSRIDSSIVDSMNEAQRKTVVTAVSERFQKGYFVIQGLPGCDKTTTMVGMISSVGQCMIVTTPSNAAVTNLTFKLYETGRFEFPELVIVGDGRKIPSCYKAKGCPREEFILQHSLRPRNSRCNCTEQFCPRERRVAYLIAERVASRCL
jgi:hypothetical protein